MRKIILLFLCSLSATTAFSQFYFSEEFNTLDNIACPFDTLQTVQYPEGWIIYQTLDGNWDGPVDSTRCISAELVGVFGSIRIHLGQIDPEEPLFLRARASILTDLNDFGINNLNQADVYSFVTTPSATPVFGTGCVQDLCTGLIIGIETPGDTRFHTGVSSGNNFPQTTLDFSTCFPTEYFSGQRLKELILKYTFPADAVLDGEYLHVNYLGISELSIPPGLVSAVKAGTSNINAITGEYDVNVSEAAPFSFTDNYLLQYTAPTFPSAQNPSFVIGSIDPNSSEQETINLTVSQFQVLEIQPFTYLAGDLVAGSDSLRHQVNLVNEGGDLCLNFVDFVVGGGDEYRHRSGSINMNNAFSCMKFVDGSALRVMQGATLHYGNAGTGMLALCANSSIILERDATLLFDGILNLAECNDALPPQQIYMDLPPGARLAFTDRARLTNRFSQGQQMLLNVRMLGGTLDDAALAPEDRALIRRIYPEPAPVFADNVSVAPNPFADVLTLRYLSAGAEKITVRWADMNGRIAGEQQLAAEKGMNEWQPEVPQASGVYLLTLEAGAGTCTIKVVKVGR